LDQKIDTWVTAIWKALVFMAEQPAAYRQMRQDCYKSVLDCGDWNCVLEDILGTKFWLTFKKSGRLSFCFRKNDNILPPSLLILFSITKKPVKPLPKYLWEGIRFMPTRIAQSE